MKKILVATDFSLPAHNAARYAIHLAKGIKANVELCHAMLVPAESPMAAQVAWPLDDFTSTKKEATHELKQLAGELVDEEALKIHETIWYPSISYTSEVGSVADIVKDLVVNENINLAVMGMSGANRLAKAILGSNSLDMIHKASFPVLLVPGKAAFRGLRKIAFATDLSDQDIDVIHSLSGLARSFDAEILITHVSSEKIEKLAHRQKIDAFLKQVSNKINYYKVYYRDINDKSVNLGLNWLTENADIDMLVMVHRRHSFLYNVVKGSHTQRLAKHIRIPLLVYPESLQSLTYFG